MQCEVIVFEADAQSLSTKIPVFSFMFILPKLSYTV